jgi:hypothetical protein
MYFNSSEMDSSSCAIEMLYHSGGPDDLPSRMDFAVRREIENESRQLRLQRHTERLIELMSEVVKDSTGKSSRAYFFQSVKEDIGWMETLIEYRKRLARVSMTRRALQVNTTKNTAPVSAHDIIEYIMNGDPTFHVMSANLSECPDLDHIVSQIRAFQDKNDYIVIGPPVVNELTYSPQQRITSGGNFDKLSRGIGTIESAIQGLTGLCTGQVEVFLRNQTSCQRIYRNWEWVSLGPNPKFRWMQ